MINDKERIVSPVENDDDEVFDVSLRPKRLTEYVGQERVKKNLAIIPTAFGMEILTTIDPDGEGEVISEGSIDIYTKVETSIEEVIVAELTTSVT